VTERWHEPAKYSSTAQDKLATGDFQFGIISLIKYVRSKAKQYDTHDSFEHGKVYVRRLLRNAFTSKTRATLPPAISSYGNICPLYPRHVVPHGHADSVRGATYRYTPALHTSRHHGSPWDDILVHCTDGRAQDERDMWCFPCNSSYGVS
jgi:hypothetical protein